MRQVLPLQVRSPMKKSPLPVNSRRQLQVPHRQAQIQPWNLWCSVSWKQANRNMMPPDESKPHTMSVTLIWIEENPEWSNTNLNMKWNKYVLCKELKSLREGYYDALNLFSQDITTVERASYLDTNSRQTLGKKSSAFGYLFMKNTSNLSYLIFWPLSKHLYLDTTSDDRGYV